MFFNTVLSAETKLSPSKETLVKFNEDIEFIVSPTATDDDKYVFRIHDEKGNFEIKSIKNDREDVNYDFEAKTFTTEIGQLKDKFEIEIIVNIQYTKNQLTFINVPVYVTVEQMKNLKLYEYFEIPLDLPGHRYLKLICYVKCVEEGLIQIHIKNPYNGLTVQDSNGDYIRHIYPRRNEDFAANIPFVFNSEKIKETLNEVEKAAKPELFQIFSNPKYADVLLITSDGEKISSYQCLLAKYSAIFESMFDKNQTLPIEIQLEEFNAAVVNQAINYLNGKNHGISKHGENVFAFADKFGINELKVPCISYMIKNVTLENICNYLEICAKNDLEILKLACKRFLKEKKAEISPELQKKLPVEILFEIFGVLEEEE